MKVNCTLCNKEVWIFPYRKDTFRFCSFSCNLKEKRIRFAEKMSIGTSERMKGNKYKSGVVPHNKGKKGQKAWNKGVSMSDEFKRKVSKGRKGIPTGRKGILFIQHSKEKHWNWKGGITSENRIIRNSIPYREWRKKVFERDNFTCVMCGYKSHVRKDIRADHIQPFSKFPNLRFEVSNGRTLCLPCDLKHGWNNFRDNK